MSEELKKALNFAQGDSSTNRLLAVARWAALKTGHRQSYLPSTMDEAQVFEPHAWVLEAMRQVAAPSQPSSAELRSILKRVKEEAADGNVPQWLAEDLEEALATHPAPVAQAADSGESFGILMKREEREALGPEAYQKLVDMGKRVNEHMRGYQQEQSQLAAEMRDKPLMPTAKAEDIQQAMKWRDHPHSLDTYWLFDGSGKLLAEVGSKRLGGGAPYYVMSGRQLLGFDYVDREQAKAAAIDVLAAQPVGMPQSGPVAKVVSRWMHHQGECYALEPMKDASIEIGSLVYTTPPPRQEQPTQAVVEPISDDAEALKKCIRELATEYRAAGFMPSQWEKIEIGRKLQKIEAAIDGIAASASAQTVREPLTEEQIDALQEQADGFPACEFCLPGVHRIARAIERAHGIETHKAEGANHG